MATSTGFNQAVAWKVTHMACPTPSPPPSSQVKDCSQVYSEYSGKAAYERFAKEMPWLTIPPNCPGRSNPAYGPWFNKNSEAWQKMRRGFTCGPKGTEVTTTGGRPFTMQYYGNGQGHKQYNKPWDACQPPAPPKMLPRKCEWTTASLPAGPQRDAVTKQVAVMHAKYEATRKEWSDFRVMPPVEPTQYLCPASFASETSQGFTSNDLFIGIVRNNKCVF